MTRRDRMRHLIVAFFISVVFCFWSPSVVTAQFVEAGVQRLEKSVDAPDFTLKVLGGGKVSLRELRGKIVLVNFFSSSCSVCERQSSSFDKMDEAIKSKDVVYLIVASNSSEVDLMKFKSKLNISMPILMDEHGSVAKAYRVRGHHEVFFINRNGKIVGRTFAEEDWTSKEMKHLIQHLLAQQK
jgi:peroxiredoxin